MQIPQQQIQLSLSQSTGFSCHNCEGIFWQQSFLIRKFNRLLTGTTDDVVQIVPVFRCQDCGEVCKEFFPEGMADVEEKLGLIDVPDSSILLK